MNLFDKNIAIAGTGNDIFAVQSDFLTDTGDIHIHNPVEHHNLIRPYLAEQVSACENLSTLGK